MSPQYAAPGVYIEEITGPDVIAGVGTSTAAFLGPAADGPYTPKTITTFDDFKRWYGRPGDRWPFMVAAGKRYYLAHAVQGFFENGGAKAVILRVGVGKPARWKIRDGAGNDVFGLEALVDGTAANGYDVSIAASGTTGTLEVIASVTPKSVDRSTSTVVIAAANAANAKFVAGDTVDLTLTGNVGGLPARKGNTIASVTTLANGDVSVVLNRSLSALANNQVPDGITLAPIRPETKSFRLTAIPNGLQPGSLIRLDGRAQGANAAAFYYAAVERTDANKIVYLRDPRFQQEGSLTALATEISLAVGGNARTIETRDFNLTVADAAGNALDQLPGLSLDPFHQGYVFRQPLKAVRVLPPDAPPNTPILSQSQVAQPNPTTPTDQGAADDPSQVGLNEYKAALKALEDVDDVNLVCIPDAANDAGIQREIINHCLAAGQRDRIAVLDVPLGRLPADQNSALTHRALVEAESGFAALYYPWLTIPDPGDPSLPRPLIPQPLAVPPSGHMAGVMARMDQTVGVHAAPANTEVRGVIGLERVLSQREQALINLEGVNALRIFPGEGRVIVWGARTTAPKRQSDWIYVNVRRLLLYIEESIQEGIRWAVFKPNDRPLWQSLKRTISDFLERVYKDGGLAGKTREQAFQVRIDEGLNPPSEVALGRLVIEIRVAPVRPAEFIVVRIGLWDGGAEVQES